MTEAAAFPAAAERLVRSAGGRRALRAALFVGVLFAFGLLFGGRAEATEAAELPQPSDSVTATSRTTATPDADTDADAGADADADRGTFRSTENPSSSGTGTASDSPSGRSADTAAEPDAEGPTAPAGTNADSNTPSRTGTSRAVILDGHRAGRSGPAASTGTATATPATSPRTTSPRSTSPRTTPSLTTRVSHVTRSATAATAATVSFARSAAGELTRTVAEPLGALAEEAARRMPESPFPRPSWPGLGDLGPGTGAPAPGPAQPAPEPTAPHGRDGKARQDGDKAGDKGAAYHLQGPGAVVGHLGQDGGTGREARRPQPQLPFDGPLGPGPYGIAAHAVSDGSAQRHGELHAAAVSGAPSFGLVAGEGPAAAHHPTRDRHRDILEFPG
ncbi:hypothetical protein [Streptomyces sp. Da 82-17]|uniref:hypothetical protein n=1 Tax=Streptomyces sp. Da 82-17 TaxID=3377116 RepID=UPI0038D4A43B